ncbi:HNH endonuclease signature motif containing protein [Beijerinckia sp. L45]|uniref:HNH endonuclease signature motif containing protein n=1 Tax=Beijerinckia sp. L45 TaxID=1641855 RepID=UPI00131EB402|nr:HNH endonuclease signature motif containing protein [Beijerinckia sp. L45]
MSNHTSFFDRDRAVSNGGMVPASGNADGKVAGGRIGKARSQACRYRAYITSDAWRFSPARQGELLASGRRCRLCFKGGAGATLTVHHRTYARLGAEAPGDLTCLCEPCHDGVTDMLRARKARSRTAPTPRDVPRIFDRILVDSLEVRS